jgi:alpha-L-arabinofuranosidase
MKIIVTIVAFTFILSAPLNAQQNAVINVDVAKTGAVVSPTLHGVFFEEISHAGEGGLYAELIQNRGFEEANIPLGMKLVNDVIVPPQTPGFTTPDNAVSDWRMDWPIKSEFPAWSYQMQGNAKAIVSRTAIHPLNNATPHSLQIDISQAGNNNKVAIINEGFWGINVLKDDIYNLNFYLRCEQYKGDITVQLQSKDGTVLSSHTFNNINNSGWKKYSASLLANASNDKAIFVLLFNGKGKVWVDFVSLFPAKTFRNRPNGLRQDLAQYIADLKPAFIRWPGGCFVEGITIQTAPDWKTTIGPVEQRTETYSPWGYYTSNGFGYHEYLQYCEDIGAAALYVFNAGVSCEYRSGTFVTEDSLQPYIQNALDAIEYAIGPVTSKYGQLRAKTGHPKPFPLKYVEVGNEQSGPHYAARYNTFYNAIKSKYPQLQIMASMGIGDVNEYTTKEMKQIDFVDEHAYKGAGWAMTHFDHFDKYPRGKWKMYVGEYATNGGVGAGNMEAALNDAVYIMSMEKNSDLVKMSSYAPLLVDTNDIDWPVNLINFDDAKSFARISYYAIKMFNEHKPSVNLNTSVQINQPAIKQPQFTGSIGLATWDTKTAYKDVEVIKDGKVIYKSDFINNLNEWLLLRGDWKKQDSALAQTADGAQLFAMLNHKQFDTYTLKLKAKKLDGYNAFIIPFAVKDSNTFYRAHIGAWVNRVSMFEKVTNGYDVANISNAVHLKDTIEANRWYDIELQVGIDTVKCFLDGKLLMTYGEPDKLFAIAGKDDMSNSAIIKVVNAYDKPMPVDILLQHTATSGTIAKIVTLSAPSLSDENSFATPAKFIPHTGNLPLQTGSNKISTTVQPFSINVIIVSLQKNNSN